MTSSLAELQQSFCEALRSSAPPDQALLNELLDDGIALQRFNIYRNNFIVLNGDALADMYPVIKRLVGDAAFRMLASAYVRSYPPGERTLLLYGKEFPGFLESIPELTEFPYLADVARLEYAWTDAYHAEDVPWLEAHQVSGLSGEAFEALHLRPHPSVHLLNSGYPIYRIWSVNQTGHSDELISLDEGASRLVVIRPSVKVEVREVGMGVFAFLESLGSGARVADAYDLAKQMDPEFDLESFFSRHLFDGTFCSL